MGKQQVVKHKWPELERVIKHVFIKFTHLRTFVAKKCCIYALLSHLRAFVVKKVHLHAFVAKMSL